MEESEHGESTYLGICKCCLKDGDFKSMWAEYSWKEEREIYGEMLKECFDLRWKQPDESTEHIEQICDSCIDKLRIAYDFKKQVLDAEQQLREHFESEKKPKEYDTNNDTVQIKSESNSEDEIEYEDVEFLEEEQELTGTDVENDDQSPSVIAQSDDQDTQDEQPTKRKWPKKKKKSETTRNYKQYSEADLRKAIKAVKSKEMTQTDAAIAFKIPRKTLSVKVRNSGNNFGDRSESNSKAKPGTGNSRLTKLKKHRELWKDRLRRIDSYKMDKHLNNIRIIIRCSNATPLKYRVSYNYMCCYCDKYYNKPDELKQHTLENHENDEADFMRIRSVFSYLVNLDITGLYCRLCDEEISTLEDLIDHLISVHDEPIFTDIPNHIIPFKFERKDLYCAVCSEDFHMFRILLEHMNVHYRNYVCTKCGEGFMTESSLHAHESRHIVGDYICHLCPNAYKTLKRLKNHLITAHVNTKKRIKCLYCDEFFYKLREKIKHELLNHRSKLVFHKCKKCGESFHSRRGYTKHQSKHSKVRSYKCVECNMDFTLKKSLKEHVVKHSERKN